MRSFGFAFGALGFANSWLGSASGAAAAAKNWLNFLFLVDRIELEIVSTPKSVSLRSQNSAQSRRGILTFVRPVLTAGASIGRRARPHSYHGRPRHPFFIKTDVSLDLTGSSEMVIATRGDGNRVVLSWRLISIAIVAVRGSTQISSSPVVVLVRVSGGPIARLLILLAGCHCQRRACFVR